VGQLTERWQSGIGLRTVAVLLFSTTSPCFVFLWFFVFVPAAPLASVSYFLLLSSLSLLVSLLVLPFYFSSFTSLSLFSFSSLFFLPFFFAPLLLLLLSSVSPTILSFFLSLLFFSQPSLCFFFLFSVLFSLLFLYFAPVVSLFSLCFHPLAHLSPVVFIRSKKGREGYYPCTEGASFAAALEAAT